MSAGEPDDDDRRHLGRMLGRERVFGVLVWVNLAVAGVLAVVWTVGAAWSPSRAVIVVLVLLASRANLRHVRSARLLRKLAVRSGG